MVLPVGPSMVVSTRELGAAAQPRGAVAGANDLIVGVAGVQASDEQLETRRFRFDTLRGTRGAPKVAMVEDMNEMRDSLRADLVQAKLDYRLEVASGLQVLTDRFEAFRAHVEAALAEAEASRRQFAVENAGFIEGSIARLQQEIHSNAATLQSRVAEHLSTMEISLQAARVREVARDEAVDRKLTQYSMESTAKAEVRWLAMKCMLEQECAGLHEEVDALRTDFGLKGNSLQALADAGFNKLDVLLKESQAESRQRLSALETELTGRVNHLEASFASYTSKGDELMTRTVATTERHVSEIRSETQSRLAWLDEQGQQLRSLVATVENIPTRRVAWTLPDAMARLPELRAGAVLRSPAFEAAGSRDLQLELSMPEAGQADGLCDLALVAPEGLCVVARLCCGAAAVQLEHTFDGRAPCVARGLCALAAQVSREDGSLHLGLEVLEAVSSAALSRGSGTSAAAVWGGGAGGGSGTLGSIVMHRYLNNRMLDLVQDQVDIMRSRMVRRIEWRVERAAALPSLFPQGECLCSTPFEAAGVQGLQLVFYPSGYAGAREGFCSYFLHVPPGAALRCWLSIGSHRREGRLAFEESGIYGRTNFCRFEYAVDGAEDVVLLVLEIEEAQQNVTEALVQGVGSMQAASTSPETRTPSPAAAPARAEEPPEARRRAPAAEAVAKERVESSLTFRRNPGRAALEDVRQLPSIWTSKPQANLAEALEGFHTFGDLKVRKPPGSRRAASSMSCRGDSVTPVGGQPPHPRYMMYA